MSSNAGVGSDAGGAGAQPQDNNAMQPAPLPLQPDANIPGPNEQAGPANDNGQIEQNVGGGHPAARIAELGLHELYVNPLLPMLDLDIEDEVVPPISPIIVPREQLDQEFSNACDRLDMVELGPVNAPALDMPVIEVVPQDETPTESEVPALEEQPKVPALEEQPKVPALEEQSKVPALEEQPKVPALDEQPKVPALEEQPKVLALEEQPKVPALEEQPKVPVPLEGPEVAVPVEQPTVAAPVRQPETSEEVSNDSIDAELSSMSSATSTTESSTTETTSDEDKFPLIPFCTPRVGNGPTVPMIYVPGRYPPGVQPVEPRREGGPQPSRPILIPSPARPRTPVDDDDDDSSSPEMAPTRSKRRRPERPN